MSNFTQKLEVIVSGNNKGALRALDEVKAGTKALSVSSGKAGEQTGDAFGMGYAKSTDKWTKFSQNILRQHFGWAGRIAADGLESFEKYGHAVKASMEEAQKAAKAAAVTSVIASAVGKIRSGQPLDVMFQRPDKNAQFDVPAVVPQGGFKNFARSAFSTISRIATTPIKSPLVVAGGIAGGIVAGVVAAGAFALHMANARKEMQEQAKAIGLTVATFHQLSEDKDFLDTWSKFGIKTLEINEQISRMRDPIEQNKKAIELLGENGIEEYGKLHDAVKKYGEAQKKSLNDGEAQLDGFSNKWAIVGNTIKDDLKFAAKWGALTFGLMTGTAGDADEEKERIRNEQQTIDLQKKLTDKENNKAKVALEHDKANKEARKAIVEEQNKQLGIYDQILQKELRMNQLKLIGKRTDEQALELLKLQGELRSSQYKTSLNPRGEAITPSLNDLVHIGDAQYKLPEGFVGPLPPPKLGKVGNTQLTYADIATAKNIQDLEETAIPAAIARKDYNLAANIRNRANYERNYLGKVRGVIGPEEYQDFPVKGFLNTAISKFAQNADMLRSRKSWADEIIDFYKTGVIRVKPINGK